MAKAKPPTKPKPRPKNVAKARTRTKPQQLAPETDRPDPDERRHAVYIGPKVGGVRVTEDTALTLGAVYACVRVISEDLAGLPWHVYERRANGKGSDLRLDDPAEWLMQTQASPETPAFQFRETLIAHALTWGNGYAEIERDGAGRPVWLWLLTPDRVCPERADSGRIVYKVSNQYGGPTYLEAEDVFHLRGLGFDGLVGYSVIQLAARSIGAGIALDTATSEFFANDSTPGGVLEHPGKLSDTAAKRLTGDWEKRHAGPQNRRKVAVLEEGMKWNQTSLPPGDTKLVEQRQFTPADICRWFRVSPTKIGDLSRATFSNIEELAIWHVTDTLMPWANRLEQEADVKLFGRTNRGRRFTAIDFKQLLRGRLDAQSEHVNKMLDRGVYDIDEARDFLDLNPIGADGKKRFVPANMQLLEKAGEDPPEPAPAPPVAPAPVEKPAPADMSSVLRPVAEDACRRLLRAEAERSRVAFKSGSAAAWLEKGDHTTYVRNQLRPVASALAIAAGVDTERVEPALAVVASGHVQQLRVRLDSLLATEAFDAWDGGAGALAESVIRSLAPALEAAKCA